jgi:hypothetical protein
VGADAGKGGGHIVHLGELLGETLLFRGACILSRLYQIVVPASKHDQDGRLRHTEFDALQWGEGAHRRAYSSFEEETVPLRGEPCRRAFLGDSSRRLLLDPEEPEPRELCTTRE